MFLNLSHERNKMTHAEQSPKKLTGRRVFLYFCLFFGTVAILDFIFVSLALRTHTGTVIEHSYKRGLDFNTTLAEAESMATVQHKITFSDNVLTWHLKDISGAPIENANVSAKFIRETTSGYDFDIPFTAGKDGKYFAKVDAPLNGAWTAKLSATFDDENFQYAYPFIFEKEK